MNDVLHVLNQDGDLEVRWNPGNPEEVARTRQMVEDLRAQGYSFFLVDGSQADAVAAGNGALNVRRIDHEDVAPTPNDQVPGEPGASSQPRRGRPRKVVAVQQQRGG